ncbi:MAG: helicase-exonuclease AddAB subunit AddA [Phycisphaerae bacterium]|nr:helicase-exonuclease AddAB subunit AddA [Phycisphaerae bacterium]
MSKTTNISWTPAQRQAIETVGRNVLVTASAGTGKTAVLSQRAVDRIADPADPARADTLLVLTFTDAAAEEMRSRIAETLYKRYLETRDRRLRQQLLLLDRAYISTIHSFCKRVLVEFFYLIELDPTFGILDADEQQLLKTDLLEETLEDAWADTETKDDLEALFAGRRVQPGTGSFVDHIISLNDFLDSVVDRNAFYQRAANANKTDTESRRFLEQMQKNILLGKLDQCRRQLDHALTLDAALCEARYAASHIQEEVIPVITACIELIKKNKYDSCIDILSNLKFGQLRKKKDVNLTEHQQASIKEPVDQVKKELKALADFALLCPPYRDKIAPQAAAQTETLLKLMRRFHEKYTAAKQRRNVLDFADLEHRTLGLLQTRPEAANKLRERFEHIFVDEYQDINAPQQRILELVSRDGNVFVVGDIKQSIYGFRQSRPEIFLSQLQDASDVSKPSKGPGRVDLKDNFRCRGEVIDFVNALFRRTMTASVAEMDYDNRAELVSGFPYPPFKVNDGPDRPVELVLLDEQSAEGEDDNAGDNESPTASVSAAQRQAAWIARRIQKIVGAQTGRPEFQVYDKKTGTFRDVEYRDIVILMRSLSHKAQDYTEILRLAGVPVNSQSACGYFETTEISDCLTLLKVLDNPDRDIEFAALLRSPVFGITDDELTKIHLHSKHKPGFYHAVKNYAASGEQTELAQKLNLILSQINDWRRQVHIGSLADLLDSIFREKGLLQFYAALPNGSQRCANLLKLHDHAIRFEHFRTTEPGAALGRFVEFLEKLDEAQQDWAPAEPDSSSRNAVRIMSIHKSKGLEFPAVFVAELNTPFNTKDSSGQCLIDAGLIGLQIPDPKNRVRFPTMAHQVIAEQVRRRNVSEEMRILYVALTRAREKLILTGSKKQDACKKLLSRRAASINDWEVTGARCHLDWILTGFSNQQPLHTLFETDNEENLVDDRLFAPLRVSRERLKTLTQEILDAKRSLKSVTEPPKPKTSADNAAKEAFQSIQDNLQWAYPYSLITQTPAKLSVSALTHRDDEFSEIKSEIKESEIKGSDTFKLTDKPDSLALGSTVHLVFEHIDLSGPVDAEAVQSTIAKLAKTGQMIQSLAAGIDVSGIVSFFDSDLGRLAQQAGNTVLREWPFTYALNAADVGAKTTGETVVLQGIIDMLIPTSEGLVIVDFKSDRVGENEIGDRTEKYAQQLRLYARAAADILNKPVSSAWLYFLRPRKAVEIKVENS